MFNLNQISDKPFTKAQSCFVIIVLLLCLNGCNSKSPKKDTSVLQNDTLVELSEFTASDKFSELVPGDVELADDCFGDIIELTGRQKITNTIFEVRETQILVIDSFLIMNNSFSENLFLIFSLPDFKLVKSFGKMGRGPDEFQFPRLVPSNTDHCLCYIYESANNNIYILNNDLSITKLPFKLADAQTKRMMNDKQVASLSPNEFVYTESVKQGKALFDFKVFPDSVQRKNIFNLSFSDAYKSWVSYIGDFGVNAEKQRAVYAYKYFKRLVFIDLENNTSRTLVFNPDEAKNKKAPAGLGPENITYYWGMSAQKDFVYVMYIGRAPVDVMKEAQKNNHYIFVEKFDWNGNPVAKYRLDRWGYFCADEQRNKLYVASTYDAEPFFEFDLN